MTPSRTRHSPLACALTAAAALLALSVACSAGALGAAPPPPAFDQEPYTHPQQLVEVAPGRRINLYCTGSGSPTVVMDAGYGDSSVAWRYVQPAVAQATRVCSYDRAGEAWSDPGPFPRTSSAIVADLRAALAASGEAPPYVLVGHSFGGLNAVVYANLHLDDLAGLVLVDPAVAGQDERIAGVVPSDEVNFYDLNRETLNVFRRCAALAREGALDPARQQETGCVQSDPAYGPELRAAEESFAARPSLWATLASEGKSLLATQPGVTPTDTREVEATRRDFGSLPLVILQASDPLPDDRPGVSFSADTRSAYFQLRVEMLNELAALSTRGSRFVVPNTSHYIQLDDPQAVIRAIEGVVCVARDPGVPCM